MLNKESIIRHVNDMAIDSLVVLEGCPLEKDSALGDHDNNKLLQHNLIKSGIIRSSACHVSKNSLKLTSRTLSAF